MWHSTNCAELSECNETHDLPSPATRIHDLLRGGPPFAMGFFSQSLVGTAQLNLPLWLLVLCLACLCLFWFMRVSSSGSDQRWHHHMGSLS